MPEQAILARAIFDNVAESQAELGFSKGEMLQVVDKNPVGYHGWWRCRLRGKEGLAAANRLQLISAKIATADYDIPKPLLSEKKRQSKADISSRNTDYDTPKPLNSEPDSPPTVRSSRSSAYFTNSLFSPSQVYSSGSSSGSSRFSIATSDLGSSDRNSSEPYELYDKRSLVSPEPPKFTPKDGDYDFIDADVSNNTLSVIEDHYDRLPRREVQLHRKSQTKDVKKRDSLLRNARVYDVLPRQFRPVSMDKTLQKQVKEAEKVQPVEEDDKYKKLPIYEPLNVTKQVAVTRITFMQSQVQTELSRLFSFVSHQKWRESDHLARRLVEVKLCCEYLVEHLKNLIRFILQAALSSARKAGDASLEARLLDLIDVVYVGCGKIREQLQKMEREDWRANSVTIKGIEEIVAAGMVLTEDLRKMTAFVLGNAQLIFSDIEEIRVQLRPLPGVPVSNSENHDKENEQDNEYEDVDYGNVSVPLPPRSPGTERKILNSYIQEVNEEVTLMRPLIMSFVRTIFQDKTVTSVKTIEQAEMIAVRAGKLTRLTDSLFRNMTSSETGVLRNKLKKIGSYIATACKRFNLELRTATKCPDDAHFRNVQGALDYLSEMCLLLKNSMETEV